MLYLVHSLSYIFNNLGPQLKSATFLHNSEFRKLLTFSMTDFRESRSVNSKKIIAAIHADMIINPSV